MPEKTAILGNDREKRNPASTSDFAGLVPIDDGQKIVILGNEMDGDRLLDLSGEPDGVQAVKKLPDGRVLLRRDYGGGKVRFAMALPKDFRRPTVEEAARVPKPGGGSKQTTYDLFGAPIAGEDESAGDYALRASPQAAFQAAAHLLPVPAPAAAGTNILKRILPHAVRAAKVAGITGATSAGEQLLRKGSVDPGEVASQGLTLPAIELGMGAGSEAMRSVSAFIRKYHPSKEMLEAFWKEGKLPLELSGKGEISQGRVGRRGLDEAHAGALKLHDEALGKFDASGGTLDASLLLDHVESEMKDPKEAAHYFERMSREIYGEKGKVGKLVPPYPNLEEMEAEVTKKNAATTKQVEKLNKGITKRNAQKLKGLDKVPDFQGQREIAQANLGLETSIEPKLEEFDPEAAHAEWRKDSEELLKKTPSRSLAKVRSFLEKDAAGDEFSPKTKAAKRALGQIDDILSDSEAHPHLQEAQEWKKWAERIKGKRSAGGLAQLMANPSEESFARALNAASPEKSIEYMNLLRSPEAEQAMSPQMRDRARKQIRNAWASKAVGDPNGNMKTVDFTKISDNLELTDEARKEILKGNYDHASIPKHVREIFSWDEEGQGILRRLSFLSMISEKGRLGTIAQRMTRYGAIGATVGAITGKPSVVAASLSSIAAANVRPIVSVAKMLYSDVGTEELARWVQMQNKIENAAMARGLKPGSSAWEKIRKQAGLELNLIGATRMFEAAIAAKEAYRLSGQKEKLKAPRPIDANPTIEPAVVPQ